MNYREKLKFLFHSLIIQDQERKIETKSGKTILTASLVEVHCMSPGMSKHTHIKKGILWTM